ncbi:KUP/HAK/KT family potassium transporter [Kitasatospora sp. KL5]|uniref:KUP/HAK/KT family potassium transporter n=1 Tax=Kitasatospora sp. KL5 TaxID=3425125 RepID=UPI003D6DB185
MAVTGTITTLLFFYVARARWGTPVWLVATGATVLLFVDQLRSGEVSPLRAPGTAVFLNRGKQTTPLAMRANVEHNHVRHDQVVILSIQTEPVPRVPVERRIVVDDLGYADDGITHVAARFGYMETPDVPGALALLDPTATEGELQLDRATCFLLKIELRRGKEPTMAPWRKRLFIATSYITADAAEYFGLPRDRTVIMGSHVEV